MDNYRPPSLKEIKKKWGGKERFEFVSLFAGGGGSSTGYRMAGGKALAVSEFIPEAQKSYGSNWPDTHIFTSDVRELTSDHILEVIKKEAGELDILDGSPPCSAFSTAGKREGGWGKEKKYSDAKQGNIEDLFYEYIRILKGLRPKVMVAENVSGLIKGSAKHYFNSIIKEIRSAGYFVECRLLDSKWLGVPQGRTRTIFVGVREDIYTEGMRLHPKPFGPQIPLREAFHGLEMTEEDKEWTNVSKYAIFEELRKLNYGDQSDKYFSLVKADPRKYSPCITATTGNRGAASPCHWDDRKFTIGEIKRIMSVPDDYTLTGKYDQRIERCGRMVPPLMMKAIADNICENILNV